MCLRWFCGAALGGYGFGTLNLWLSGEPLLRAALSARWPEPSPHRIFKWARGLKGSTGLIFVPAFATTVAWGGWGCFLSGLEDRTYGTPTTLPWAVDLGDGITRHPVQLYEFVFDAGLPRLALGAIGQAQCMFL